MSARAALDLCRWLQTLGLRPSALLVAHAIGHRLGPEGVAWPSLASIARDTGLARSTVKVALGALEERAVITRERRVRSDGSHGSTVYTFGGQWDLFRMRGGVGRSPAKGRPVTGQASLRTERSKSNGARDSSPAQGNGKGAGARCPATIDLEAELDAQEARAREAGRRGFVGPWDDVSVRTFLEV